MSNTAKLGAFMLAALAVVGFFILRIERLSLGGGTAGRRVAASFPSVAGLNDKSPVRIAGVKVGIVEGIELTEDDRALVRLGLDEDVELRQGARAIIRSLGLLGEQYVEVEPGPPGAPPLPEGAVLPGTSPSTLDEVFSTAGDLGGDLKAITASLRASIAGPDGERRLQQILANIEELTASLRSIAADNRDEVGETISNVRDMSATLRTELPKLAARLDGLLAGIDAVVADNRENIAGSVENVRDLTDRLRVSADNLNTITGKIARGEGSIGKLINDPTTVDTLNSTLESVEAGVASLQETLGRAQRWRLDVDINTEQQFELEETRFQVNADLATTKSRFFRLGVVRAPYGNSETTLETITTTVDGGPPTVVTTERLKEEEDAFAFNAQVGYRFDSRWGRTALRAGLLESWGGVGIDQALWDDRIGLTFDAFDFGRDEDAPHLRFEGRFFITPNIYTYAGYNDPLSSRYGSAVVGAGLRWTDEDLKYLLGTAASAAGP